MTEAATVIVGFSILVLVGLSIAMIWSFALDVVHSESLIEGCLAIIGAAAATLIIILGPFVGADQ